MSSGLWMDFRRALVVRRDNRDIYIAQLGSVN
jgi:hypothetical protein